MKKIISLAMCLILLLSLCACGKSKQAKAVEEQISTIGDVSLEKEATILSTLENYNQLSDAEKETVENYSNCSLITASPCSYSRKTRSAPACLSSRTCRSISCLLSFVEHLA